jgi:uncharacterized protein (TIGR00645 family)
MKRQVEKGLENFLFAARWLAAPIYLGLVFCLFMLLVTFVRYMIMVAQQVMTLSFHDTAVAVVAFIDLALIANLVLIVIFVGYENFVSRLDLDEHADKPSWIGEVDYTGLKMKLFSSLVAITGIDLLKQFMELQNDVSRDVGELRWMVGIHVVFLVTLVMSALANWLTARSRGDKPH